jgi:phage shock protein PspC (stress-responsive transcriptional regulator)/FtsH-binding integral membrane protein
MTTTDTLGAVSAPSRVLRRSRTDRVGAGVAGGLGEYFAVDPVLFRVLFATSAFFGGAGILAYLIAWAAIPEAGTQHAALDGWVQSLRARRVRGRIVAVLAVLLLWAVAFSWWAPGPFFPVMVVVLVLVGVLTRRESDAVPPAPTPVDLTKPLPVTAQPATGSGTPPVGAEQASAGPTWMADTREWIADSRRAHRERRRRAQPVRLATLAALTVTLVVLGLVDAARGIVVPTYFFVTLGIVGAGLLVGLALRRTPVSLVPLLVPALIGSFALAGSSASLHDGVGERSWLPTASAAHYKLAFGRGTLDLRSYTAADAATLHVTVGAGQVRILAPASMDLTVRTHIRFGQLEVDRVETEHGSGIDHVVSPPAGATGSPVTVDVELGDGQVRIDRG